LVSISVGEGFATQFQAYCKHFQSLDWKQIYAQPESIKGFELDKLWAIVGGLGEQFTKLDSKGNAKKNAEKKFDAMLAIVRCMKKDFAVVTLKMLKEFDGQKFGKLLSSSKYMDEVVDKYAKYVIG
jgi:hypothetical protein